MTTHADNERRTWQDLLLWTRGQTESEHLAADVLNVVGFQSIDPSHPLGGPDGLKDITLRKDGIKWIAGVYFANNEKRFSAVKKKFLQDRAGAIQNTADGFVFVTNQPISLTKRAELEDEAQPLRCEIYHLERLRLILDSPRGLSIRHGYLGIPPTPADLLAGTDTLHSMMQMVALGATRPLPQIPDSLFDPGAEPHELSVSDLVEEARQKGNVNLERGYMSVQKMISPLANPDHPVGPIVSVDEFPKALADCHRASHETALLCLFLHRCIGLPHMQLLNSDERRRISSVVERLWRCVIRLEQAIRPCERVLVMVGANRLAVPCAHKAVQWAAVHLLQEITHASEGVGYSSLEEALSVWKEGDPLPFAAQAIVNQWPRIVTSLVGNSTIHEGFSLLADAFRELPAEAVRAARFEKGLPIIPAWLQMPL